MLWPELQKSFSLSLRDLDRAPPSVLGKTLTGMTAHKRFNVYRNNMTLGLTDALGQTFSVTHQIVGEEFFQACAKVYVAQTLPSSPVLLDYGESFGDFLNHFEPAQSLPFLGDLAQLEWYWHSAYHGADKKSVGLEKLAALCEQELLDLRFQLHPTLHFLRSEWPVFSIWHAHQTEHPEKILPELEMKPEAGLIFRPHLEVLVLSLNPLDIFEFYHMLERGQTLGEAAAYLEERDLDLSTALRLLFETGFVTELRTNIMSPIHTS